MTKHEYQIVIVVTVFVVIAAFLTWINQISDKSIMGVKAYIAGEGQWTKAQKQATHALSSYIVLGDELYFEQFKSALEVTKGDKRARLELSGDNPDMNIVVEGFRAGRNAEANIPYLIWTFENFKDVSFMAEAIRIWADADVGIDSLEHFAEKIYAHKQVSETDSTQQRLFLEELMDLDEQLTELENAFSEQISFAAHQVRQIMFMVRIAGTVILMMIGAIIILFNIRRTNQLLHTVSQNRFKLSNILAHSKDVIFQLNISTLKYEFLSDSIMDMLGYRPEEVLERGVNFMLSRVHPDDQFLLPYINGTPNPEDLKSKTDSYTEIRMQKSDGEYIWVSIARNLIKDENGNAKAIVGSVRDITDKKITEDIISKSLDEKNLLLSEIHHRVKNNLAIISALLELQADITKEAGAKEALEKSQSRIRSIASVHEMLYKTGDFSGIDLKTYVETLFNRISDLNDPDKRITFNIDVSDIKMSVMHGAPFGLLLNELITNSFKHAFEGSNKGSIVMKVNQMRNQVIMEYSDTGVGLTQLQFDSGTVEKGLGLTLIKALIQQLNGSYNVDNSSTGFHLTIRFEI
jgi:PAS domain S-box-containing protein